MTMLVVTRGVPGSGKSTWALAWVAANPGARARVNRDALRQTLYGRDAPLSMEEEDVVTVAQDAAVESLLRAGTSVVVDDTHIRSMYVRRWERLARDLGVEFFVNETFRDVPLAVCDGRNKARWSAGGRRVPIEVTKSMHDRLHQHGPYEPLPPEDPYAYEPSSSLPAAWLVDLDGTLALMDGRGPFDWHRVGEDKMKAELVATVNALHRSGFKIIVLSGRDSCCRSETEAWLAAMGVDHDLLLMRPEGDSRRDSIVKLELFREHVASSFHAYGVFDDRDQVVAMWRRIGLMCAQVAPGNF